MPSKHPPLNCLRSDAVFSNMLTHALYKLCKCKPHVWGPLASDVQPPTTFCHTTRDVTFI